MTDKKKVLIIDDDMDFREMATIVLESVGYDVQEAEDGAKGLAVVKSTKLNFILLDVMMEEVDTGVKLAQEIASASPGTPIVILSSFADAAKQLFDTTALPVKEYLQKPLKSDELLALVKKYA
jgi:DNA-binding NtrC family response regulator